MPFGKNCSNPPKKNFDVLVVWGGQVHPKQPWKYVGDHSLPFPGPGKNVSLEAKFRCFLPWRAYLGPP